MLIGFTTSPLAFAADKNPPIKELTTSADLRAITRFGYCGMVKLALLSLKLGPPHPPECNKLIFWLLKACTDSPITKLSQASRSSSLPSSIRNPPFSPVDDDILPSASRRHNPAVERQPL